MQSTVLGCEISSNHLHELATSLFGTDQSAPENSVLAVLTFDLYALIDNKLVELIWLRNQLGNDAKPVSLPTMSVWFDMDTNGNQSTADKEVQTMEYQPEVKIDTN